MFDTETLNHEPVEVVQQLLVDLGLGTLPADAVEGDFKVYAWTETSGQGEDLTIAVLSGSGVPGPRDMITGADGVAPGVQFRVRARGDEVASAKAGAIRRAIMRNVNGANVTLEGSTYRVHCFSEVGPVIDLGEEEVSECSVSTLNALVVLRMI